MDEQTFLIYKSDLDMQLEKSKTKKNTSFDIASLEEDSVIMTAINKLNSYGDQPQKFVHLNNFA